MKASELRKSILQMAVQGKLVPQNSNDEPAANLLKQIRTEKANLIKEGKLKKEKPLPPITENEIPNNLPKGWSTCRLNELVSKVGSGSTPSGGRNTYVLDGVKFLRSQNVHNDGLRLQDVAYITNAVHEKMKNTHVKPKDILLNITGASIGRCCIVPNDFDAGNVNQHVSIIRLIIPDLRHYLHIFLLSPFLQKEIMEQQVGMSREGLSGEKIKKFIVPIPPFQEQKRIVEKVNELMAMCDELEAAENELETFEDHFIGHLPKSILQMAVQGNLVPQHTNDEPASELLKRIRTERTKLVKEGKIKKEKPVPPITEDEIPYDLPEGWVWCRLGELCNYGMCQNINPENIPGDAWLLELEDIEKDSGTILNRVTKKVRSVKSTKHFFRKGQVLYGKLRPYLNKVVVADTDGYCSSEILPLSFGEIDPHFAATYLRSPYFTQYANSKSYGVKMPRLGTNDGKMALFALPPIAEQRRILSKVDKLMNLYSELNSIRETPPSKFGTVLQFPQRIKPDNELNYAARGDGALGLSAKAMQDADELFMDN